MSLEQTQAFHFDLLEEKLNRPWCRWCLEPLEVDHFGRYPDFFFTTFCRRCDGDNPRLAEADAWWSAQFDQPKDGEG
jgi:hypothetical protein